MKKSSGFTLIELVVVIVILGILAATAAPKFMDLQKDARISALNGLMGAMKSANSMVYSKAILAGKDTQPDDVICSKGDSCAPKVEGEGEHKKTTYPANAVRIKYGHPVADENGIVHALQDGEVMVKFGDNNADGKDWVYKVYQDSRIIRIVPAAFNVKGATDKDPQACYVEYKEALYRDTNPQFTLVKSGCQFSNVNFRIEA